MIKNESRNFSKRALHKIFYLKLLQHSEIRNYLGLSPDKIKEVYEFNEYGPTYDEVHKAINELVEEGVIEKSPVRFYGDKTLREGFNFNLTALGRRMAAKLVLPFDLEKLRIPTYLSTEKLIDIAKQRILNDYVGKEYQWRYRKYLRISYSLFRELYVANKIISKEDATQIVGLIKNLDEYLELSPPFKNSEIFLPPITTFIDNLLKVLQINSPSGSEREVAEFIANCVNEFSYAHNLQSRILAEVDEDNILKVLLKGENLEKILFVFHLDTVKGFYQPEISEGYIYGRGAVDNKLQGMVAIYSLMIMALNRIIPPCSLVVLGVPCEEVADKSKRGILKAIEKYQLSIKNTKLAIILEATDLNIAIGQRPRWSGEIDVYGPGVHVAHVYQNEEEWLKNKNSERIDMYSSYPDLRALVSHIEQEMRKATSSLPNGGEGKLGKTTITVKTIFEDVEDNQTPSHGVIKFDIRLGDESYREFLIEHIKEVLAKHLRAPFGFYWRKDQCSGVSDYLSGEVGNQTLKLLKKLNPFLQAINAKIKIYEFGTDGRYLVEAGIPTIGLAPGDERFAHRMFIQENPLKELKERIKISDLFKAVVIYFELGQLLQYDKMSDSLNLKLRRNNYKVFERGSYIV